MRLTISCEDTLWVQVLATTCKFRQTANVSGGYAGWSGTSFSSPVAAGVTALMVAANVYVANAGIVDLLINNADDLGPAGFDVEHADLR